MRGYRSFAPGGPNEPASPAAEPSAASVVARVRAQAGHRRLGCRRCAGAPACEQRRGLRAWGPARPRPGLLGRPTGRRCRARVRSSWRCRLAERKCAVGDFDDDLVIALDDLTEGRILEAIVL